MNDCLLSFYYTSKNKRIIIIYKLISFPFIFIFQQVARTTKH